MSEIKYEKKAILPLSLTCKVSTILNKFVKKSAKKQMNVSIRRWPLRQICVCCALLHFAFMSHRDTDTSANWQIHIKAGEWRQLTMNNFFFTISCNSLLFELILLSTVTYGIKTLVNKPQFDCWCYEQALRLQWRSLWLVVQIHQQQPACVWVFIIPLIILCSGRWTTPV